MEKLKIAICLKNQYIADFLTQFNKFYINSFENYNIDNINYYDLFIIENYLTLIKTIRLASNQPIIVISSERDYQCMIPEIIFIEKPFKGKSLINIINNYINIYINTYFINNQYSLNKLSKTLTISYNNYLKKVRLTEKEVKLIEFLIEYKSKISKKLILEDIWNYCQTNDTHTIATHIYRIRQKLGCENQLIMTIDDGYILNYE